MNNKGTKRNYSEEIHRAIDYIEEHLSENITLEKLAGIACFSPFHFHRVFVAETGETPRNFVERNKLEKAAGLLFHNPLKTISDISLECGFSSASAFSRAFKKQYGTPPGKFFSKHINDFHYGETHRFKSHSEDASKVCRFNVFAKLPSMHLAYCQTMIGYATGMSKSWKTLLGFATLNNWLQKETRFLGIPFDNPNVTPAERCRYRACISIPGNIVIKRGKVKTMDIPAGNYALFHFKGKKENIADAYVYIYGEWLPQSGFVPGNIPLLELYPPEFLTQNMREIIEYDIALPLKTGVSY